MFRLFFTLVGSAGLAWIIGIQGLAAHLIGLAGLIMMAAFAMSAIGSHRDRPGRELYHRNLRDGFRD